jgi:hypothetical protein
MSLYSTCASILNSCRRLHNHYDGSAPLSPPNGRIKNQGKFSMSPTQAKLRAIAAAIAVANFIISIIVFLVTSAAAAQFCIRTTTTTANCIKGIAIGIIVWTCASVAACIYTAYSWGLDRWLFVGTITRTVKQLKRCILSPQPVTPPLSSPSFHSPELPIELNCIDQAPALSAE